MLSDEWEIVRVQYMICDEMNKMTSSFLAWGKL